VISQSIDDGETTVHSLVFLVHSGFHSPLQMPS